MNDSMQMEAGRMPANGTAAEAAAILAVIFGGADEGTVAATIESIGAQTIGPVRSVRVSPEDDEARGVHAAIASYPSPYLLLVEAGVVLGPTFAEECIWAIETTENGAIAHSRLDASPEAHDRSDLRLNRRSLTSRNMLTGPCLVRRDVYERGGGARSGGPGRAWLWDLWLRCSRGKAVTIELREPRARLLTPRQARDERLDAAEQRWVIRKNLLYWYALRAGHWLSRAASRSWEFLGSNAPWMQRLLRRLPDKLFLDGIDGAFIRKHPFETVLRLLPNRLKGEWWVSRGLPVRSPERSDYLLYWQQAWESELVPPVSDRYRVAPGVAASAPRVLVLHPYMEVGGAEAVLLSLLERGDPARVEYHVISTHHETKNPWEERFRRACVNTFWLPGFLTPTSYVQFISEYIGSRNIDVVFISLSEMSYRALATLKAEWPDVQFCDILHAETPYAPVDLFCVAEYFHEFLDLRVVTTESLRLAQIERYSEDPSRVIVIANGIDTKGEFDPERYGKGQLRSALGIPEEMRIVLFFGRFSPEKQPMHVVEIAERLRHREDVAVAMFGGGPLFDEVSEEVRRRGLLRLYVGGRQASIADGIADADVLLFPSQREGLPISGIEAMSMGKPVVASRVPGWLDLVEDGVDGLLVEDGDFDGYVRAIESLLDDDDFHSRAAASARRKAVGSFEITDRVHDWETLFARLAAVTRAARTSRSR